MITHIYPLSRVQEAFDLRNDKSASCEAIHVLIDCQTASEEVVRPETGLESGGASGGRSELVGRCC